MRELDDDVACVAECLRGDTAAFGVIVTRHQRVLFSVALRLVGNHEDARDATQNAFIRAYQRLHTYDPGRKFFSWMYRIVVNECLNLRRSRRTYEPLGETIEAEPTRDAAEAAELNDRVDRALVALTSEQREVVVLKYFLGLTYEEIADVVRIPEKTVKSRLFTARQRLADILMDANGSSRF
jgi:RNA polymerase sigma-70 factor (ECF subfamily)